MPGEEAALAQLGGGIINSAGALWGAQQQRNYGREMSNTAHQREVRDLIAAGLNPILSATGGKGASTPQVEATNPGQGLGEGIAAAGRTMAIDAARLKNETAMAQANSALAKANKRGADANTALTLQGVDRGSLVKSKLEAKILQTGQATKTSSAQEEATRAGIKLTGAQTSKTEQEAAVMKTLGGFITRGGDAIKQLVDFATAGGKIGDAAYDVVEGIKKNHGMAAYPPAEVAKYLVELITKYMPHLLDNVRGNRGDSSAQDAIDAGRGP